MQDYSQNSFLLAGLRENLVVFLLHDRYYGSYQEIRNLQLYNWQESKSVSADVQGSHLLLYIYLPLSYAYEVASASFWNDTQGD